jgi:hypothetical protein
MDESAVQSPVLHLDGFPLQDPELHLVVSGQREPVLLLDLSTLQRTFNLSKHWVRSFTRTCLHYRDLCSLEPVYTLGPEHQQDVYALHRVLCCTWTCLNTVA